MNEAELKQKLRCEMKARRAKVSPRERLRAAQAVCGPMETFLARHKPHILGLYHHVQSEFETLPLAALAWKKKLDVALPVVVGQAAPLLFCPWKEGEPLEPGAFKILEPSDKSLSVFPDVLLIPLLAFDQSGARLGYGGGFYDRTISQLRARGGVCAIGLAYDFQELPELPTGPYDEPLDFVLTPSGFVEF